ncbi:MAG TPA: Ku protein [Pseudomonadales bacterium]
MAARAMASGTISFGLVSIPVKLYSTVDTTKSIHFNYLTPDGDRVKQQYVRASTGEPVERDELVQGYEFAKGQFVLFEKDELKALHATATNEIDIQEFVPLDTVERIYIDKVYYLGPDKGAARSYHLLKAALRKTGRAALARYATRGKSYLVLLRPMDDGLVLEQLKHADELRSFADVPLEHTDVADAELDLAIRIIEQRVSDRFEPDKYHDEVRERFEEAIAQKVEGKQVAMPREAEPQAQIIDLMEALRASVGEKAAPKGPKPAARAQKKAPAKRTGKRKSG